MDFLMDARKARPEPRSMKRRECMSAVFPCWPGKTRSTIVGFAVAGLLVLAPQSLLAAQQQTSVPDSLRIELAALKARIDSLEAVLVRLTGEGERTQAENALTRLRAAAAAAAAASGADTTRAQEAPLGQVGAGRQRSLQALNPEISVTGDIFARLDPDHAGEDNFFPREFELSLVSALDPFSRAKVFMSLHEPGGELAPFGEEEHAHGDPEFGVEEGYLEWVNIPGGLGLTLGRFYQHLGTLNRWHSHALYFQSRSLPHLAFVGEEPLAQTGVSLYWLLPVERFGTWQAWFEVTRAANESLFGESKKPSYLGHLNAFWDLSPSLDLDLGISAVAGQYQDPDLQHDQHLFNVEGALTWRPPGRAGYREAVLRGGIMVRDPGRGPAEVTPSRAMGIWSLAEVRVGQQWLVGARYDWVENPEDSEETAWLVSPTLTWWQSEYVRVRAEYDVLGRIGGNEGQLLLQVTFAMGPHKHEKY
jgi:hypothetical protein